MKINWGKLGLKQFAAIVAEHLDKNGINATLVGGACVSIYSHNKYLSSDLDFVTGNTLKELGRVLKDIGFKKKGGRLFKHDGSDFVLDFVPPPIAIGDEPVRETALIGKLKLLTPSDCVKDRLAAYYHWNDYQSLEQALMVMKAQKSKIKLREIERWSKSENQDLKFKIFLESYYKCGNKINSEKSD